MVNFKSSLRNFNGRHYDLVDRYGISVISDHGYVSFVVLSSFMIYHRSNTAADIDGSGNAHPSGAPELTPDFCGVRVAQSLSICVVSFFLIVCPFSFCFVCLSIYGSGNSFRILWKLMFKTKYWKISKFNSN